MRKEILPRKYREYLGLGAEIALSLAGPMIGGYYIDVFLDSSPIGILIGVALGLLLFFLTIMRIVSRLNSSDDNDSQAA